jgi:hypothetical protein
VDSAYRLRTTVTVKLAFAALPRGRVVSEEPPNSLIEGYFGWVRQQAAVAKAVLASEPISTLEYAEQLRLQQEGKVEAEESEP